VKTCPDDNSSIMMMNMEHWWNQGWPTSPHRSYVLESYYIKLCYWNYSGDQGLQILSLRAASWPVLVGMMLTG